MSDIIQTWTQIHSIFNPSPTTHIGDSAQTLVCSIKHLPEYNAFIPACLRVTEFVKKWVFSYQAPPLNKMILGAKTLCSDTPTLFNTIRTTPENPDICCNVIDWGKEIFVKNCFVNEFSEKTYLKEEIQNYICGIPSNICCYFGTSIRNIGSNIRSYTISDGIPEHRCFFEDLLPRLLRLSNETWILDKMPAKKIEPRYSKFEIHPLKIINQVIHVSEPVNATAELNITSSNFIADNLFYISCCVGLIFFTASLYFFYKRYDNASAISGAAQHFKTQLPESKSIEISNPTPSTMGPKNPVQEMFSISTGRSDIQKAVSTFEKGGIINYLKSEFEFAKGALYNTGRAVANLVLALLLLPTVIFSAKARYYVELSAIAGFMNIGSALIGTAGAISPHLGKHAFNLIY